MNQHFQIPADLLRKSADGSDADALAVIRQSVVSLVEHGEQNSEAVAALKARLDSFEKKANRFGRGDDSGQSEDDREHRKLFSDFVRKGREDGLRELETKAMSLGTPSDGGYALPKQLDDKVFSTIRDISPVRAAGARVVQTSSQDFRVIAATNGFGYGWVAETASRTESSTPTLAEITLPAGELYAMPSVSQWAIDDMFFDVDAFVTSEVAQDFGKAEAAAFVTGDGTNKPKGILAYTFASTSDATRAFGTLQYIATGVSGAWPATTPSDALINLVYALAPGYRQNAAWLMPADVIADVRKFRDQTGQLLWTDGLPAGQPPRLLGYPVYEANDLPARAANSLSILFGDFNRGYTIGDRIGIRLLRDPFTKKGFVNFYTTRRVGGAVIDSRAIKALKFSAS